MMRDKEVRVTASATQDNDERPYSDRTVIHKPTVKVTWPPSPAVNCDGLVNLPLRSWTSPAINKRNTITPMHYKILTTGLALNNTANNRDNLQRHEWNFNRHHTGPRD